MGIGIGNPPQLFRSLIDLSWSDLFVPSSKCQDDACDGHYKYNSSWSRTYQSNGTESWLRYPGFRGKGYISQDTLYAAGLEIKGQLFHEIIHLQDLPAVPWTHEFDAVLGLAPGDDASLRSLKYPLSMMVSQNTLDTNIISLALGATVDGDRSFTGEIMFGGINGELYEGDLSWLPLTNVTDPDNGQTDPLVNGPPLLNGTWQVEARAVTWGNSDDERRSLRGFTARIDSAIPIIYLPPEISEKLKSVIKPENIPQFMESVDCDHRSQLPHLTFDLGGHDFILTAYDYTLEMTLGDYGIRCVYAIEPLPQMAVEAKDMIVLGSPFLRGFYSVFDYDRRELGCKFSDPGIFSAIS